MSELLESYQKVLDTTDFDRVSLHDAMGPFLKEYQEKMTTQNDLEGLKFLQLEQELLSITKSVEDGLSPVTEGSTKKNGKEVKVIWPDFNLYGKDEFDYFETRYNTTPNLFLKTEYGLLLFLKNKLQHNDERKALCTSLINLLTAYKEKALAVESGWARYSYNFHNRLADVFSILVKSGDPLKTEREQFVKLIEDWLEQWPIDHDSFISYSQTVVQSFIDFKKQLKNSFDADKVIKKLDTGILHFQSNVSTAIYIAKEALDFSAAYKPELKDNYILILANLHEKAGDDQVEKHPIGAVKEFENALKYYTAIKDENAISRVSIKYEANKGKVHLGTVSSQTDEEESKKLNEFVDTIVNSGSVKIIMDSLCGHRIFPTANALKIQASNAMSGGNSFVTYAMVHSYDKYGNTLRIYTTDEEKEIYNKLFFLGINYQYGVQIIFQILSRALRKQLISYENVKVALEQSWINQPVEWMRHGKPHSVIPLNAVLPGIENFFNEIDKWVKSEDYSPNFVLCTDSMATKIEMLLRYLCKHLEIPTFQYHEQRGVILTEEKLLGKLLENLEGKLSDDDHTLIKLLLNEKGGNNIRNRVAHGLVDFDEYSYGKPLVLLGLILRLSMYTINKRTEN